MTYRKINHISSGSLKKYILPIFYKQKPLLVLKLSRHINKFIENNNYFLKINKHFNRAICILRELLHILLISISGMALTELIFDFIFINNNLNAFQDE